MYRQFWKKPYFSVEAEQNLAITKEMVLELEAASFAFSGESLFLQDLRKHSEFGRIPVLERLQSRVIQTCVIPTQGKPMLCTLWGWDTQPAWEPGSFLGYLNLLLSPTEPTEVHKVNSEISLFF